MHGSKWQLEKSLNKILQLKHVSGPICYEFQIAVPSKTGCAVNTSSQEAHTQTSASTHTHTNTSSSIRMLAFPTQSHSLDVLYKKDDCTPLLDFNNHNITSQ